MFFDFGLVAWIAPSFLYTYLNIKDQKLGNVCRENELPVIQFFKDTKPVSKNKSSDEVVSYTSKKMLFPIEPYSILTIVSFFPIVRHGTLIADLRERHLIPLMENLNRKIECENCKIVSAFWQLHSITEENARCPHCKNRISYIASEASDDNCPYFKRKNKKEIRKFVKYIDKHKPAFSNPIAEEQVNHMIKLNENKGFIDASKGPRLFEMDEIFRLSENSF